MKWPTAYTENREEVLEKSLSPMQISSLRWRPEIKFFFRIPY